MLRASTAGTKQHGLGPRVPDWRRLRRRGDAAPRTVPSREAWCWARIEATKRQLATLDPALPVVFVNHYPLVREPTRVQRYPQFAQWCATKRTEDWHVRFNAAAVVYGHVHIPRVTWYAGAGSSSSRSVIRGCDSRNGPPGVSGQILPVPEAERVTARSALA